MELNKIFGAILFAALIALGLGAVSDAVFAPDELETAAFVPEGMEEEAAHGDEDGEPVADEGMSVLALLATTDAAELAAQGEKGARQCAACHKFEEGGAHGVGPALWGIHNREIASVADYSYSAALAEIDGVWDYEALDGFLEAPTDWAPGTKMSYRGIPDAEKRAAMIAYLRSLSSDPAPLPEADGEAAGEPADAEAAESEAAEDTDAAAAEAEGETETAAVESTTDEAETPVTETAAEATEETATDTVAEAQSAAAAATAAAGAATEEATAAAGEAAEAAAEAAEGAATELVALVENGEPAAGEKVARKCKACHSFDEGGKNRVGPNLWGIVGRDIASVDGFSYSDALADYDGFWTTSLLDTYLLDPKTAIPGNKMSFAGLRKDEDRANIIAYLKTLSSE